MKGIIFTGRQRKKEFGWPSGFILGVWMTPGFHWKPIKSPEALTVLKVHVDLRKSRARNIQLLNFPGAWKFSSEMRNVGWKIFWNENSRRDLKTDFKWIIVSFQNIQCSLLHLHGDARKITTLCISASFCSFWDWEKQMFISWELMAFLNTSIKIIAVFCVLQHHSYPAL